jgi:hypothetical protein
MTRRTWLVDLVATVIVAVTITLLVGLAGGPLWAQVGFGVTFYLLRPVGRPR